MKKILPILLFLILGITSGWAQEITLKDDAYHYPEFQDGHHDLNYIEWWYFNLDDPENNLQAIITYGISDPEGSIKLGGARLLTVVYLDGEVIIGDDFYSRDDFSASVVKADVAIGDNRIEVFDEDTYRVAGSSRNGVITWDLTYTRRAEPWGSLDRVPVGGFPWEVMSWMIYMPGAEVEGEMTIDGKVFLVSAKGYHDHNWGEWIFSGPMWNWAQYYEEGLTFDMGDIANRGQGGIGINYLGTFYTFAKDQYHIYHSHWTYDRKNRSFYPEKTVVLARNQQYFLRVEIEAIQTVGLTQPIPKFFPQVIIYEQTAFLEGKLWEFSFSDGLQEILSFSGRGFNEYTAVNSRHFSTPFFSMNDNCLYFRE